MMWRSFFLAAITTFFGSLANAAEANSTYLMSAETSIDNGSLLISFSMDRELVSSTADVKFLRRTIEWDLKGVQLKKDKIFLNVGKNDVNNIYVSQVGNQSTRIRINLENGKIASNYHDRVAFSKNGHQMIMKLDSSIPLITNNITELNRIYDIEKQATNESSVAQAINEKATLKVSAETLNSAKNTENTAAVNESEAEVLSAIDESKNENEIPVLVTKDKSKEAASSPWVRILVGLGVLGGLLLSVVLVSKKIQQKRAGAAFNHDSIKVVSQKYLGPKRCLTLVRVSGEYLLLGVTDHNISLVKSLSVINDELPNLEPKDFGSTIKGMQQKIQDDDEDEELLQSASMEDKFTVSSLSDVKKILKKRKYIDEADV